MFPPGIPHEGRPLLLGPLHPREIGQSVGHRLQHDPSKSCLFFTFSKVFRRRYWQGESLELIACAAETDVDQHSEVDLDEGRADCSRLR